MINGAGSHEVKALPLPGRKALVWTMPTNPYYKQMLFEFTEKDRLFLIRFNLKNLSFRDARGLKKALFDKYGISWETPWTMKIKDSDAQLYGPPGGGNVFFFELTNPKTGEKAMELMDVRISKDDREKKSVKKDGQKGPQALKTDSVKSKSKAPVQEAKPSLSPPPAPKEDASGTAKQEKAQKK